MDLVYGLSPNRDKTNPDTAYGTNVTLLRSRTWIPDDVPFLWEMLYRALHVRHGQQPFPRSVLQGPGIAHYLEEFGTRPGDDAHVALDADGQGIERAGFDLRSRTWRAAELSHETTPQAFLTLQRRA